MDQYLTTEELGKGSYGRVSLVVHKSTTSQYVLKSVDLSCCSAKERKGAELEVRLLSTLRHPNIVRYKDSFESKPCGLHIVMEYCENGDLYSLIKARDDNLLPERLVLDYFVQICMALQYLHERNILHRDLKTQNIFLTKNNVVKVGDFGIARLLESNLDMATTLIGTPYYMSPEIFQRIPYSYKSDVWALGCCLFELCTLRHPFNAKDLPAVMSKVLKGKVPPLPSHYSPEIRKILTATLHLRPEKRPSASKILRHSFVKQQMVLFLKSTGAQLNASLLCKQSSVEEAEAKAISSSRNSFESDMPTTASADIKRPHTAKPMIKAASLDINYNVNSSINNAIRSKSAVKRRKPRLAQLDMLIDQAADVMATTKSNGKPPLPPNESSSDDLLDELKKVRSSSAPNLKEKRKAFSERRVISAAAAVKLENGPGSSKSHLSKFPKIENDVEAVVEAMKLTLKMSEEESSQISSKPSEDVSPRQAKRVSSLRRRCTVRLSKRTITEAFEIMQNFDGDEMENELRRLLNADYDHYAPLLLQLKLYDEANATQLCEWVV